MADTVRGQLLEDARDATEKDRNDSYGEPTENFTETAALWSAYLWPDGANGEVSWDPRDSAISTTDFAVMMILMKIARLKTTPRNRDTWLDIAGYAACGWECAA